ncbi:MAG: integral rane protein YjbE family [Pelosinus sp.]|jgi:YjbE family integral membrane protein|nr:integral rane protein YjbE family [Pelosinus sp.]
MEYMLHLFSIIIINILLSGDNALVIALASRNLPISQQRKAMVWGCFGAIILRIGLTFIAVFLLKIPYLQILAGLMLLWIAIKLVADQKDCERLEGKKSLNGAIKTIITADFVMSLDNVIAIIGVAQGNIGLVIISLVVSIPIIIWGSNFVCKLIQKWPIIIIFGSFFLGWTAAHMILSDYYIVQLMNSYLWLKNIISGFCGLLVVIIGKIMGKGKRINRK